MTQLEIPLDGFYSYDDEPEDWDENDDWDELFEDYDDIDLPDVDIY